MDIFKRTLSPRAVVCCFHLIAALILTLLAGELSIHLSQMYYQAAPFHYDSAYYLYRSIQLYDMVSLQGKWATLWEVLHFDKDFLDTVLRVLFFPTFLQTLHGHMVIALPFMVLFVFLALHYVNLRTGSWGLGWAVVGFLFCSYFIYVPYQGIADYWKESIAIWILGSAVLSWLLADTLKKPLWSFLCGTLLGALVMERTGLALYMGLLWAPLFLIAFYQRLKHDALRLAFFRTGAFVMPAVFLTGVVVFFQWQLLYQYYFVKGYDYVSFFQSAKQIVWLIYHFNCFLFPTVLLALLSFYTLFFIKDWQQQWRDLAITTWIAAGFPAVIAATGALYNGFYNSWYLLLVVFFASLMPVGANKKQRLPFLMVISFSVLLGALFQYHLSQQRTQALIDRYAGWRTFYENITDVVLKSPKPRMITFLVDENFAMFFDHLKLNRGKPLNAATITSFMSIHDSYYQAQFQTAVNNVASLADGLIKDIEADNENNLVVAYCDTETVSKSPAFPSDGLQIARPVIVEETRYLEGRPNWHVMEQINSPYGCVKVYQFHKTIHV